MKTKTIDKVTDFFFETKILKTSLENLKKPKLFFLLSEPKIKNVFNLQLSYISHSTLLFQNQQYSHGKIIVVIPYGWVCSRI